MARQTFTQANKINVTASGAGAGTTTLEGSVIDMQGYDSVTFVRYFATAGTATNGNTLRVAGSTASGGTYVKFPSAEAAVNSASTNAVVEVYRPDKRYVKAIAKRGTSSVVGTLYAIRSLARDLPVTNAATGGDGQVVARIQNPTSTA